MQKLELERTTEDKQRLCTSSDDNGRKMFCENTESGVTKVILLVVVGVLWGWEGQTDSGGCEVF